MPGIVSLLPSATEWVFALGLDADLRGVTFECDEPAGVAQGRAVVVHGLPTTDADGRPLDPGAVDALVRDRLAAGEPLYTLDTTALARIAPDVVLTQDLCAVCALPANAARQACELVGNPADVVTLDPHTLGEVLDGATAVGAACGVPDRGVRVRERLTERLHAAAAGGPRRAGRGAADGAARRRRCRRPASRAPAGARARVDRPAVRRRPLGARAG